MHAHTNSAPRHWNPDTELDDRESREPKEERMVSAFAAEDGFGLREAPPRSLAAARGALLGSLLGLACWLLLGTLAWMALG